MPARNVVACSSGTAALHLALEALLLPQGSSVVVPDFTMVACPRAVVLAGLRPVFVDCLPGETLMDSDDLDLALSQTPDAKVIMAVHVYGRRAMMGEVHALAAKYGCAVVEDLAEAHGVEPHPLTDAACWSYYRNKVVAGEEGGAVRFRHTHRADVARQLRCMGFTETHDFMHVPRGHNYRMADLLATPILASLALYDRNLERRRAIEARYDEACPPEWRCKPRDVPWVYDLRVKGLNPYLQDVIVEGLHRRGVEARHAFKPMRLQPEFAPLLQPGPRADTNADRAAREVLYLPIDPYRPPSDGDTRSVFQYLRETVGSFST